VYTQKPERGQKGFEKKRGEWNIKKKIREMHRCEGRKKGPGMIQACEELPFGGGHLGIARERERKGGGPARY